jgi:hypothetical protein
MDDPMGNGTFRDIAFEVINNPRATQDGISKKLGISPAKTKQ